MLDLVVIDSTNLECFAALLPTELVAPVQEGKLFALGGLLLETEPVAALTLELEETRCRLCSFYVSKYSRRMGMGTELMQQLEGYLRQLPEVYLLTTMVPPDADGAVEFLEHCGFSIEPFGVATVTLTVGELAGAAHIPPKAVRQLPGGRCLSLAELPKAALQRYRQQLAATDGYLARREMDDPAMLAAVSQFCVEGEEVTGCLLFSQSDAGICLEFMQTEGGQTFLALLSCAAEALRSGFAPETPIFFEPVNEIADQLVGKILPGATRLQPMMARKSI